MENTEIQQPDPTEPMPPTPSIGASLAILFVAFLIIVIPTWKIFKRAGFSPLLSLLLFIPGLGGMIVPMILAFADWPALRSTQREIV